MARNRNTNTNTTPAASDNTNEVDGGTETGANVETGANNEVSTVALLSNVGKLSVSITKNRTNVHNFEIDFDALPETSKRYIIEYGIKQSLNDAHASTKDNKEAVELAEKRLKKILDGTVNIRASSAEPSDPIEAEYVKLARKFLEDTMKAQKINPKEHKDAFPALIEQLKATEIGVKYLEEAKRRVEVSADIKPTVLNLASLGLAMPAPTASNAAPAEGTKSDEAPTGGDESPKSDESAETGANA